MTDEPQDAAGKSPVEAALEHAVDALVYAPIGMLFDSAAVLPQLVEKGRNQVSMARMIGKFAIEQGREEALKAAGRLQDQAAGVLDFIGGAVTPMPAEPAPAPSGPRPPARGGSRAPGAARQAARRAAGAAASIDGGAHLAIPDYDGLSASHVVNRLAGLAPEELEAVRQYEAAHRGRKTILSKVAQLQST